MNINFLHPVSLELIGISLFGTFFVTCCALVLYGIINNLKLIPIQNEVLKNTKDSYVITPLMIRASILKKYPKAYDFETNLSKFAIIIFTILFLIPIGTQLFFGSWGSISTKMFYEPFKEGVLYQDVSGKFSFKVSPEFKLETTDFGGIIYKEDHRKLKENDPQKYGEVPNLQISFELVDNLPKSLPGGPDINLTREKHGEYVVFIGEVIPSQMPNKHYFVMLPVGYLDLRVDPIFDSINDDERLYEISNQLKLEIKEIISSLKIPAKK